MKNHAFTKNVLLVDDEQSVLDGLRRAFHREPVGLFFARSAEEALDIAKRVSLQVIISDHHMPGMLGTELLAYVREEHPEILSIMLTGAGTLGVALEAVNRGEVFRLYTKPCDAAALRAAVRDALLQRSLISQARRLADLAKQQAKLIRALEREAPGISHVDRDSSGAIVIPASAELNEALEEVLTEFEATDLSLRTKRN